MFQRFRPGFDLERALRAQAGVGERFDATDLYEDARPCVADLQARGPIVGVAGNQTRRGEQLLRGLRLPVDWIGTSAGWGVEKPSRVFSELVVAACGCRAPEVAYVGDRLDNDVAPAYRAGLVGSHRQARWSLATPQRRRSDDPVRRPSAIRRR